MSNDIVAALKGLSLHGMASAWPEVLGTARIKTLDHETVLHQLLKAEAAQREVRSMAYQMRVARFQSHRDLTLPPKTVVLKPCSKYVQGVMKCQTNRFEGSTRRNTSWRLFAKSILGSQ